MDFTDINYLKVGSAKQKQAYYHLRELNIFEELKIFNPVLCGTVPLDISLPDSDLDIIMEVKDFKVYKNMLKEKYSFYDSFHIKEKVIKNNKVVKSSFLYKGVEIELFGQSIPVQEQNAYLHMVIEYFLIKNVNGLKEKVIKLKKQGYKTEPAFAYLLKLSGDPYESLIEYGRNQGII